MMKVLIVEDEINNVEVLEHLLVNFCEGIDLLGSARNVDAAIEAIETLRPDLVLLDVQLESGTGFDVVKGVKQYVPKVIFITGYEHYAIEAIKVSAIDYILKPVNIKELQDAINKAKSIQSQSEQINLLMQQMDASSNHSIWLNDTKKAQKVKVQDILFIKADSVYSEIVLQDGTLKVSSLSLNYFEKELDSYGFYRIHKSYVINVHMVTELESGRGGLVMMRGGKRLPVAYRRKTGLKKLLGS